MDLKAEHNNGVKFNKIALPIVDSTFQIPSPKIVNVVGKFCTGIELKLDYITIMLRGAEYNPTRFSGCVLKLLSPRITALIFSTGRIIVTGASSEECCYLGARKLIRILSSLRLQVKLKNFHIINMVGQVDLKFPVRLEEIADSNEQKVQYEPEIFPALYYRVFSPKMTFLIFVNGQVLITGAKSQSQMIQAFNNVYPVLRQYRKMK